MNSMISALWAYRGFVLGSVGREFQAKYRNSVLGVAWTLLNPLAMVVVYTVIFSQIMRARLPGTDSTFAYSIYLCSGIFAWGLFAEIVGRGQNVFLENANLLKKLSFPRLCLPVIVVCSAAVNFAIIFSLLLLLVLLLTGHLPGWPLLGLIPVLLLHIAFSVGLGVSLGVLNVFFRDVGQFFTIVLQFWFWFTPIVYPITIIPEKFRWVILLNPLTPVITAYQTVMVNGQWPDWNSLLLVLLFSLFFCALAIRLFRRHAGEMVDEL